jgi:FixJ family two-component response regulator
MADLSPKVFIVDDDVSVRESLEALFGVSGWAAESFCSAEAFLACVRPRVPSCLILDVSLPDLDGLQLQSRILSEGRALPIIFITGHGDVPMTVQAMKAGAVEFLTKPFEPEALLNSVRNALRLSEVAIAQWASLSALREKYVLLSPRELEVMALVVTGLLNKQVGSDLGISEITVKAHRGRVMRKMDAGSLPELVNMAVGLGILQLKDGMPAHRSRYRLHEF